jgi:hypothetical protein
MCASTGRPWSSGSRSSGPATGGNTGLPWNGTAWHDPTRLPGQPSATDKPPRRRRRLTMPRGACVVEYGGKRGRTFRVKYRDADGRQVMETSAASRTAGRGSGPKGSSGSCSTRSNASGGGNRPASGSRRSSTSSWTSTCRAAAADARPSSTTRTRCAGTYSPRSAMLSSRSWKPARSCSTGTSLRSVARNWPRKRS